MANSEDRQDWQTEYIKEGARQNKERKLSGASHPVTRQVTEKEVT